MRLPLPAMAGRAVRPHERTQGPGHQLTFSFPINLVTRCRATVVKKIHPLPYKYPLQAVGVIHKLSRSVLGAAAGAPNQTLG